jgi:VCBS repeat-containing protein
MAVVPNASLTALNDSRLVVAGGGGGNGNCGGALGGDAGVAGVIGPGNGGFLTANCGLNAGGKGGFGGGAGGSPGGARGRGGAGAPIAGGGGGGYWGGGGGRSTANASLATGGGGGSSFWVSGATDTSMSTDTTGVPEIQITPEPNTAPTAAPTTATTDEDVTSGPITLSARDANGDATTFSIVSGPSHGTLSALSVPSCSGTLPRTCTVAVRYTPAANFNGSDSFSYRASDGSLVSNVATVSITVRAVNDAPVAASDAYSTNEDTPLTVAAPGVLGNDSDVDGDALTASLVSAPSHGSLTLNSNGSFTYSAAANFNGGDSFSYRAGDGSLVSSVATVSITVRAVNDAPTVSVAGGGACGADDRSGTINLAVADADTAVASLRVSGASNNPALVPNANLSFAGTGAGRTLTAAAVAGRVGTATITVIVSDGSATGTVTVTLRAAGNGKDTLTGTAGADMLFGQNGKDTLSGLAGNDLLCGGRGKDRLTGGLGADHFGGGLAPDTATDFNAAQGDTKDATTP